MYTVTCSSVTWWLHTIRLLATHRQVGANSFINRQNTPQQNPVYSHLYDIQIQSKLKHLCLILFWADHIRPFWTSRLFSRSVLLWTSLLCRRSVLFWTSLLCRRSVLFLTSLLCIRSVLFLTSLLCRRSVQPLINDPCHCSKVLQFPNAGLPLQSSCATF
jgi:hypothetical protein